MTTTITAEHTYTSTEVRSLAGLTIRELDYWARTGVLSPSAGAVHTNGIARRRDGATPGSGWTRLWTAHDVDVLRSVKMLTVAGVDLGRIRDGLRKGNLGALKADLEQAFAEADRVGLCG